MFPSRTNTQLAQEATKRELRARISRQRLRIERDSSAVRREAAELRSWRTYVRRYPGTSLIVALVAGFFFSAGVPSRGVSRWLVRIAAAQVFALLRHGVADEFRTWLSSFWSERS